MKVDAEFRKDGEELSPQVKRNRIILEFIFSGSIIISGIVYWITRDGTAFWAIFAFWLLMYLFYVLTVQFITELRVDGVIHDYGSELSAIYDKLNEVSFKLSEIAEKLPKKSN